jgi:hypothetical protein
MQFSTGASPTHEFSSILARHWLLLLNSRIHAHCIAVTELDTMLYGPVLCFELNSRLTWTYTCILHYGFSGCLPNIANLKLSASRGLSCAHVCVYVCVCVCIYIQGGPRKSSPVCTLPQSRLFPLPSMSSCTIRHSVLHIMQHWTRLMSQGQQHAIEDDQCWWVEWWQHDCWLTVWTLYVIYVLMPERISHRRAKQKAGYFFVAHPMCVCVHMKI